jgi:hypothetical protein
MLTDEQAAAVQAHDEELGGLKFLPLESAAAHIRPSLLRRLRTAVTALESGQTVYTEFGRPL